MFKKILLPVDLTDKHKPALDAAAKLAGQYGGTVTLLHVVEIIPGLPMEEEGTFYGRLERVARNQLQQLGKRLEEASPVAGRGPLRQAGRGNSPLRRGDVGRPGRRHRPGGRSGPPGRRAA